MPTATAPPQETKSRASAKAAAAPVARPDALADIDAAHADAAWAAINAYFDSDPYALTRHHLESYDHFLTEGVAEVVRSMNPMVMIKPEDGREVRVEVSIGEGGLTVDRPTILAPAPGAAGAPGATMRPLTPNEARLKDLTYAVRLYATLTVRYSVDGAAVGEPVTLPEPVCLGAVPLLLHSRHCALHGLPAAALRELGECPHDRGGYFVVDGREKVVITTETTVRNRLYLRDHGAADPKTRLTGTMTCTSETDTMPRTVHLRVRAARRPSARRGAGGPPATRPHAITVEIDHLVRTALPPSAMGRKVAGQARLEVPLATVFRALGVESDRAILEHVVYDVDAPDEASAVDFLRASLLEGHDAGVRTQRAAIAALAPHTAYGTPDDLKRVLEDNLFPNVGPSLGRKALQLGHVVRELVRAALQDGKGRVDRDDYVNKRLLTTGTIVSNLFRDLYFRLRHRLLNRLDVEYLSGAWRSRGATLEAGLRTLVGPVNVGALVQGDVVTDGMRRSFKGDWGGREVEGLDGLAGTDDGNDGLVQDLNRMSYLTYVSHVRRVNNPIDRSVKLVPPHRMLASQWGAVCPVESPDGPNIGLLKHLALLAEIVPRDGDLQAVRAALTSRGLLESLDAFDAASRAGGAGALSRLGGACKVLMNDTWSAVTFDPPAVVAAVRALRRTGAEGVSRSTSVMWDIVARELHVHTDAGRVCRPLVRADPATRSAVASFSAAAIQSAPSWSALYEGADAPLDRVDVEELRSTLVAMRPSIMACRTLDTFTHVELHPVSIFSAVTATYPMLHHNNAAYNVLCLAQFKQALGVYATSFLARMDTMGAVLTHAQRALVSTRVAERLADGQHAHGQNLVVAIAPYTGYNQEDAVILNRDSVERGMFNLTVYKTHRFEEEAAALVPAEAGTEGEAGGGGGEGGGGVVSRAVVFGNPADVEARGHGPVAGVRPDAGYGALGPDGAPRLNAEVLEGDVVMGRVEVTTTTHRPRGGGAPVTSTQRVDRSARAGRKHAGMVDRVVMYPSALDSSVRACKVRLRQTRVATLGDKVASRFGQKGVVGMLVPARDMPFCAGSGVVPDLMINPLGFPKRMTVTHLLECLLAKAGALGGRRYHADTFERLDVTGEAGDALEAAGLARSGCEVMRCGRTGDAMHADIFIGVNYYGRLKHMSADKFQSRARGRVNALVRQPVKAEGESGGLRMGEMEQNAMMAHGLAAFVKEAFVDRSDGHRSAIDAEDGVAVRDARLGTPHPRGDARDGLAPHVVDVAWPYAFKLLTQELAAMAVDLRLVTQAPRRGGGDEDEPPAAAALSEEEEDEDEDDGPGDAGESDDDEAFDDADGHGEELGADGDGGRAEQDA